MSAATDRVAVHRRGGERRHVVGRVASSRERAAERVVEEDVLGAEHARRARARRRGLRGSRRPWLRDGAGRGHSATVAQFGATSADDRRYRGTGSHRAEGSSMSVHLPRGVLLALVLACVAPSAAQAAPPPNGRTSPTRSRSIARPHDRHDRRTRRSRPASPIPARRGSPGRSGTATRRRANSASSSTLAPARSSRERPSTPARASITSPR